MATGVKVVHSGSITAHVTASQSAACEAGPAGRSVKHLHADVATHSNPRMLSVVIAVVNTLSL